jgi:hypothetical protein
MDEMLLNKKEPAYKRVLLILGYLIFILVMIAVFVNFVMMAIKRDPYGTSFDSEEST